MDRSEIHLIILVHAEDAEDAEGDDMNPSRADWKLNGYNNSSVFTILIEFGSKE